MRAPLVRKRTAKVKATDNTGIAFLAAFPDKDWEQLDMLIAEQAVKTMESKEDCAALCREPEDDGISDASLGLMTAEEKAVKETTYTIVDEGGSFKAVEEGQPVTGTVVGRLEVTADKAILSTKQLNKAKAMFDCAYMETAGKERKLVFEAQ